MDPTAIIVMLVVGAIAGWLAGMIYEGAGFGLVGNIIVGILVGAIVTGYLLPGIIPIPGIIGQIIDAAIGAIILLFLISLGTAAPCRKRVAVVAGLEDTFGSGPFTFNVLASIAQFEREVMFSRAGDR